MRGRHASGVRQHFRHGDAAACAVGAGGRARQRVAALGRGGGLSRRLQCDRRAHARGGEVRGGGMCAISQKWATVLAVSAVASSVGRRPQQLIPEEK